MITVLEIGFLGGPYDGLTFAYTSSEEAPGRRVKDVQGGIYVLRTISSFSAGPRFCYVWEELDIERLSG